MESTHAAAKAASGSGMLDLMSLRHNSTNTTITTAAAAANMAQGRMKLLVVMLMGPRHEPHSS